MVLLDFLREFFKIRSLGNLVVVSALRGLGIDSLLVKGETSLRAFEIFRFFKGVRLAHWALVRHSLVFGSSLAFSDFLSTTIERLAHNLL